MLISRAAIRNEHSSSHGKGGYHDSDSFTGTDLLIVLRLASKAYTRISQLRQRDRRAREEAAA